jgi:glycosyltransferase involved in cell wall biosynthesis
VGAAIRTGVEAARYSIVASIDADCTYDPHELQRMVPLLEPQVAMVTASPYHPQGGVKNVPHWRLFLSRGLSQLYRPLVNNRIHTVTSCCRVYRRDVVLSVPTQFDDYRGIAEWLIRIDHAGGRIVEHPTVLEARVLGTSKMNVVRCIVGHVGLLSLLIRRRLSGRTDRLAVALPGTQEELPSSRALSRPATV